MRGGFVGGMVLGALGGAIIGMMYGNPMKTSSGKYLMGKAKRLGKRRGIIMRELANEVQDWVGGN